MKNPDPLPLTFYSRPTLDVAFELIGKCLIRRYRGKERVGRIVETEAYTDDPASHAHRGRTKRNSVMFGPAGHAYVYFIYGMYYCFNIVTECEGTPGAVLIRAVEPLNGIELMSRRRQGRSVRELSNGPGKLCQALAIGRAQSGLCLRHRKLFLTDDGYAPHHIRQTPRVGIRVATDRLWRFVLDGHPCVSPTPLNQYGI